MKLSVKNPTHRSKAVRESGGLTVIKPGKSATVDADWSEEYRAKLKAAGLKIAEAEKAAASDEPELDALKARADELKIEYGGNIGADTLRERITEAEKAAS